MDIEVPSWRWSKRQRRAATGNPPPQRPTGASRRDRWRGAATPEAACALDPALVPDLISEAIIPLIAEELLRFPDRRADTGSDH
jgi:hypothetical protein